MLFLILIVNLSHIFDFISFEILFPFRYQFCFLEKNKIIKLAQALSILINFSRGINKKYNPPTK